jgi:hypothetical protein
MTLPAVNWIGTMGYGDDIMATGMARGAAKRGKRIAFGDGERIIWGPFSDQIFKGNPNIAPPGSEKHSDIEWIDYYKGHRIYNRLEGNRWIYNYDFRVIPGELFFDNISPTRQDDLIVIEPNTKGKTNKQWPVDRYQTVADQLLMEGFCVAQPIYFGVPHRLNHVKFIQTKTFFDGLDLLRRARLFIGPEGGLHHASAAIGLPAVVVFGGFTPIQITGYDIHVNLGETEGCGNNLPCTHCVSAMAKIEVDHVTDAAMRLVNGK